MKRAFYLLCGFAACLPGAAALGDESGQTFRYVQLEAKTYSIGVKGDLESYRSHGSGSCAFGGELGLRLPPKSGFGELQIRVKQEQGGAVVWLTTQPSGEAPAKAREIELPNFTPKALQLAKDDNGRSYYVQFIPRVIEKRIEPKSFREAADDLYTWGFNGSRVVLNDRVYLGPMLGSGGQVVSLEVCGVARVEFSLHRLKGSKPWGKLQSGRLTIEHPDGDAISIGNVTNGPAASVVPGGPYRVWVRWDSDVSSVDEYRSFLSEQIKQLKSSGSLALPGGETERVPNPEMLLQRLQAELDREPGPWVIGSGHGSVGRNEIEDE